MPPLGQGEPLHVPLQIEQGVSLRIEAHRLLLPVQDGEAAFPGGEVPVLDDDPQLRVLSGVGESLGLHLPGGCGDGAVGQAVPAAGEREGGIHAEDPVLRKGPPASVKGVIRAEGLVFLKTVQTAAHHILSRRQGAVLGRQVDLQLRGAACPGLQKRVIQAVGQVIPRRDIGALPVFLHTEQGEIPLRDIAALSLHGDGLHIAAGAEPGELQGQPLRRPLEGERSRRLRKGVLPQGEVQGKVYGVPHIALPVLEAAREKKGVPPRLQGPQLPGPIQPHGERISGFAAPIPVFRGPYGLYPLPAPGFPLPEQGI